LGAGQCRHHPGRGGHRLYLAHLWPDLIAGLGIGAMNLDAAKEVWEAAHEEHAA